MPSQPRLVYWDSMVIIHRIQGTPEHIQVLRDITDAAERGEVKILLSTYSIAEIVKDPDGGVLSAEQDQKIMDLFEQDYFIIKPVTMPIAHLSRQISRKFGVKPKDAVHLATAEFWKVPEFHTYEDKLLSKTGLIGSPPLRVEKPTWTGQLLLLPVPENVQTAQDEVIIQSDGDVSSSDDTSPQKSETSVVATTNKEQTSDNENSDYTKENGKESVKEPPIETPAISDGAVRELPAVSQVANFSAESGDSGIETSPPPA